ncbi:hypothetical protein TB2_031107 [Malus domestica]
MSIKCISWNQSRENYYMFGDCSNVNAGSCGEKCWTVVFVVYKLVFDERDGSVAQHVELKIIGDKTFFLVDSYSIYVTWMAGQNLDEGDYLIVISGQAIARKSNWERVWIVDGSRRVYVSGGETELLAKENGGHCSGLGGWRELEEVSEFEAERGELDSDDISLFSAHKIRIDHCSLSFCADGLIDAIMRSTGITISNNYFAHHNEVMLLGLNDKYLPDSVMQVTIAFNHFGVALV